MVWKRCSVKVQLVWTTLTLEDRVNAGYSGNDDADLVNMLSTIDDSDITVIFVQQKDGRVKVSWRAVAGWDVSQVALQFGGGGHPAAAGADITGDLETVRDRVLKATRVILNGSARRMKMDKFLQLFNLRKLGVLFS
jgi:bifunctional oligoribonuclease and PAP phosphatase NrnA